MQQPPQYPAQGQQGVVYVQPPPQPNYIIQNVPPSQTDCCGGPSEQYSANSGLGTGITHLVIGVFCIILSGVTYAYHTPYNLPYGIWSGVFFYIPTGILGIISKNRNTGVITAYLVMGVFSALEAFGMMVFEGIWSGVWSIDVYCYSYCHGLSYNCSQLCRSEGSTAIHAVLAILALFEFVVSIVGAAYCCGGLRCCCASPTTTTTVQYQNQPQQVAIPVAQPQGKM